MSEAVLYDFLGRKILSLGLLPHCQFGNQDVGEISLKNWKEAALHNHGYHYPRLQPNLPSLLANRLQNHMSIGSSARLYWSTLVVDW